MMVRIPIVLSFSLALHIATIDSVKAAENATELYALKEKCMATAAKTFKDGYGNGHSKTSESESTTTYENHYNTRLQRCLVLVYTNTLPRSSNEKKAVTIELWDILENRMIGSYFSLDGQSVTSQCFVADKYCRSKAEWQDLIDPYMKG